MVGNVANLPHGFAHHGSRNPNNGLLYGLGGRPGDGNGKVDALTDGLLMLRYLFGVRGSALVAGTIGTGATRTTSQQIEAYLSTLTQ